MGWRSLTCFVFAIHSFAWPNRKCFDPVYIYRAKDFAGPGAALGGGYVSACSVLMVGMDG
jgi:hypothetical protein